MNQYYKAVSEAKKANLIAHPMAGGYQGTGTLFLKEVELPGEEEIIKVLYIHADGSWDHYSKGLLLDEFDPKTAAKAIIKLMEGE